MAVEIKRLLVTPEQAEELLARNELNRRLSPSQVARYATEILETGWIETGETIKISTAGVLIDGQHRLKAIVQTGRSVWLWIAFNIPEAARAVVDSGITRSAVDRLRLATGNLAITKDAAAVLARLRMGLSNTHRPMSTRELERQFQRHGEAIAFAQDAFREQAPRGIKQAAVLAVVARAWYSTDHGRLRAFGHVVTTGKQLDPRADEAAVTLRNVLIGMSQDKKYGSAAGAIVYAKTERALRAFLDGERLTKLYEAREELFPIPGETSWPLDSEPQAAPEPTRMSRTIERLRAHHADA